MKFKYNSWLMLVIYGIYATYSNGALADTCYPFQKTVDPGKWCEIYNKCPDGCYCTGQASSKFSAQAWKVFETCGGCISNTLRYDFEKICKSPTNYDLKKLMNIGRILIDGGHKDFGDSNGQYWREVAQKYYSATDSEKRNYIYELMKSIGMYTCPAEFPNSDTGEASKEADCYASANGQKVYNKTLNCKAGQYLPRNSNSCTACKTGSRYYCPGGTFHTSTSHDMGLKIKCEAGQYLPGGASSCQKCKTSNRYYVCSGGTFASYFSGDQGIRKCTGGSVANAERTACESGVQVPAGQYLPANSIDPVPCTGATKYCPGGEFEKASVEQGRYDCPLNGRANSDKTACVVSVSKTWMQYGPTGANTPYKRQCWHQADALDPGRYIACVLSGRYYR